MEHNTVNRAPAPSLYPAFNLFTSPASYHEQQQSNLPTTSTEHREMDEQKTFAYRVLEHVKMGPKLSVLVKRKLRLGAKIIQKRGRENIFKQVFEESEDEKLLKASQCYLSTDAGPIIGILFISSERVAFCSDTSIRLHSTNRDLIRDPYKVQARWWFRYSSGVLKGSGAFIVVLIFSLWCSYIQLGFFSSSSSP